MNGESPEESAGTKHVLLGKEMCENYVPTLIALGNQWLKQGVISFAELPSSMPRSIPTFDKALWSPSDEVVFGKVVSLFGIPLLSVEMRDFLHLILHKLYYQACKVPFEGHPRTILLGEAIAGCIDFYVDAMSYRQLQDPSALLYTATHQDLVDRYLGPDSYIHLIKNRCNDPYSLFKEAVHTHIKISATLSKLLQEKMKLDRSQVSKEEYAQAFATCEKTLNLPFQIYLNHFDFGNYVLFAGLRCGQRSTPDDGIVADYWLHELEQATDFEMLTARMLQEAKL